MSRLCPTAEFFLGALDRAGLKDYYLPNGVGSAEVCTLNDKQINPSFLKYNRIITIPLARPRNYSEGGRLNDPFLFLPDDISPEEEAEKRREARLNEIYSEVWIHANQGKRMMGSSLGREKCLFEMLRSDQERSVLVELFEKQRFRKPENMKPVDLVCLRFDVEYQHSIPIWILKEDYPQSSGSNSSSSKTE